jgi:hypothetical protein
VTSIPGSPESITARAGNAPKSDFDFDGATEEASMTTDAAGFMTRFGEVWVTGKTGEVDDMMPADVV